MQLAVMRILRRAIADTFSKRLGQLVSAATAGLAGWLYLYFQHGEDFAVAELPFMIGAIVGTATFVAVLFLWNLAAAPYRIERDRADALEGENANLRAVVKPKGRSLTPTQIQRIGAAFEDYTEKDKHIIIWSFQNEEALIFAEYFREAFRKVGWKNASVYTSMIGGSLPASYRDVVIIKYGFTDISMIYAFSDLLTEFGVAHRVEDGPVDQTTEFLRLIIGRQS